MQGQVDYITLSKPMEEEGISDVLNAVVRERRSSLGEAILTGGAAVDSINTYLQSLAAKAELKRKEHKKKRKERRANKDKKRSRKRSRSYTLPDPIIRHDDEASAKAAHDERAQLRNSGSNEVKQNERLVAHTTIQTSTTTIPPPALATSTVASSMPAPTPMMPPRHSHPAQSQLHSVREFSRSFPTLPLIHDDSFHPVQARSAFSMAHHAGMGASSGEMPMIRPMPVAPSMSMPVIPAYTNDLMMTAGPQQMLGVSAPIEDGWQDASAMSLVGSNQQMWFGNTPSMPLAVSSTAFSPAAFDDSLLNSFLSADILQGDEAGLLADLI